MKRSELRLNWLNWLLVSIAAVAVAGCTPMNPTANNVKKKVQSSFLGGRNQTTSLETTPDSNGGAGDPGGNPQVQCGRNGVKHAVGETVQEACPAGEIGQIAYTCQANGLFSAGQGQCVTNAVNSYQWVTSAFGSCSAQGTWQSGAWAGCQNTSCTADRQQRAVTCQEGNGTQSRFVSCRRADGVAVADSFCSGAKPAATVGCSSSCDATVRPETSQACPIVGRACVYDLTELVSYPAPAYCSPHGVTDPKNIKDALGYAVVGTGSICGQVGMTNSDGFWAPAMDTPGCPAGTSRQLHLVHTCRGHCPSGKWTAKMKDYNPEVYGLLTYDGDLICDP